MHTVRAFPSPPPSCPSCGLSVLAKGSPVWEGELTLVWYHALLNAVCVCRSIRFYWKAVVCQTKKQKITVLTALHHYQQWSIVKTSDCFISCNTNNPEINLLSYKRSRAVLNSTWKWFAANVVRSARTATHICKLLYLNLPMLSSS